MNQIQALKIMCEWLIFSGSSEFDPEHNFQKVFGQSHGASSGTFMY